MLVKIKEALELLKLKGADFADIRITQSKREEIITENMIVKQIVNYTDKGIGIRVVFNGALGFACTRDLEKICETALDALEAAKASGLLLKNPVVMNKEAVVIDNFETLIEIDPFDIPKSDKVKLLLDAEKAMNEIKGISRTYGMMSFIREEKVYADISGSYITQTLYKSGAGIEATAITKQDTQVRTYPSSERGNHSTAGYEYILSLGLVENAKDIARQAKELIDSEECPKGNFDVIIDSCQLAFQIHESIGHAVELDRILGKEAGFSGTSFLHKEDCYKNYEFGSEHITIVANPGQIGGLGSFGYDDDGIKAHRTVIIKNGILKEFLTSIDNAQYIDKQSNGSNKAESWKYMPINRITNISLIPGKFEFDELLNGIRNGLYLCGNKSWSIDDKRLNFQFTCELAYEIKNGKFTGKIYKNPTYSGTTIDFWKSCDGVCNNKYWKLYGFTNCGKGQPVQIAHVGHGASPARFRNVKVGF